MINAIIVDDELGCVSLLQHYLNKYCPKINIVATASEYYDAQFLIKSADFDVAFLDVELHNNNNIFSLFEPIDTSDFDLIFVTSFEHYAVKAFKVQALDYILKPLLKSEIERCYYKILNRYNERNAQEKPGSVLLKDGKHVYRVPLQDIFCLKANGVYTHIFFEHNNKYKSITLSRPIGDFERQYEFQTFFRIHKSYLVNPEKILQINNKDAITVILQNKMEIPVAKRRLSEFKSFIDIKR